MAVGDAERAVGAADRARGRVAKRAVAGPTSGSTGFTGQLLGMKSGEGKEFGVSGGRGTRFHVRYDDSPSYGDNNFKVPGATVGRYTIHVQRGDMTAPTRDSVHEHGPHATTDAAARRGANPNAKYYAADQAGKRLQELAFGELRKSGAMGTESAFHDRRR